MHRSIITAYCLLLFLLPATAAAQLRVEITALPDYTPVGDSLYLTGTFNDWQPGDDRFRLQPTGNGRYAYDFLTPMPDFAFKVTRGSWPSVEGGPLADPIDNRTYRSNGELRDTLRLAVASWEDMDDRIAALDTLVVRIVSYPASTPEDASLFVTGSFNGWSPRDEAYRVRLNGTTPLVTRIPLRDSLTEFKITRGSWSAIESRANGLARPNRTFRFTGDDQPAVANVRVENWEDLAGPAFGPYTLFLLLAALQSIILAVVLMSVRAVSPLANRLLAGLLLLVAVATLARLAAFDKDVFQRVPKLLLLPDLLYFLAGPLLYLWYRTFRRPERSLAKRDLVHLLPLLLAAVLYLPLVREPVYAFTTRVVDQSVQPYFLLTAGAGWVITLFYGWHIYRLATSEDTTHLSRPARGLQTALAIVAGLTFATWTASGLAALMDYRSTEFTASRLTNQLADLTWLLAVMAVYPVSYFLLRQPQLFRRRYLTVATEQPVTEANTADFTVTVQPGPAVPPKTPPTSAPSIRDEAPRPPGPLEELMAAERPHLNPRLTLAELARLLDVPPHQLSRQLNEEFGKSFFDFVNGYRVSAFQEAIAAGAHRERTLLSLALEAGFNSKTSFNRAFKKHVGLTPRQYLQQADNQSK